jgi:uncharacterized repeat protein (TIGR03803 family)
MRWFAMQRTQFFSSLLRQSLTVLALTATLAASAEAQPKFKILHTVPGGLFSGLTFDAKGNLYGVTGGGGDHNDGTIFELTPGGHGWTLKTLHSFNGQDGGSPNGGLIFDASGSFYGTALGGRGLEDGGVAYEMVRGSGGWDFTVLYYFCVQYHCPDGGGPGPLTMDGAGNLFGLAGGGTYDEGVAFELVPGVGGSDWKEQVLYDFQGTKTGFDPSGALIFDTTGDLYGATAGTFNSEAGTVFELIRGSGSWRHRKLWQFDGTDGAGPRYGVIFGRSRDLYGATAGGGSTCNGEPCGTVFKLAPTLDGYWKEEIICGFRNPSSGFYPSSRLILDKAGNLYGATAQGGAGPCYNGCGVVYELSPGANGKWTYRVLHKFIGNSGSLPPSDLVLDQKGNLYGTAYGAVYEITP